MFAQVDCYNFYASCERVFKTQIIGKLIVVLSNNDYCILVSMRQIVLYQELKLIFSYCTLLLNLIRIKIKCIGKIEVVREENRQGFECLGYI